jgi:hypothetical protein
MTDTPAPSVTSPSPRLGIVLVALGLYLVLMDAAIETVRSGSPVRWWVAGTVALYLAVTVLVWIAAGSLRSRIGSSSAALSFFVLLGLLAVTAWLPEGLQRGMILLRQPTSIVLSAVTGAAIALAGIVLTRSVSFLPLAVRGALALMTVYSVAAFAVGIMTNISYADLLQGHSEWRQLPRWLQGAFVGGLALVPLALLAQLANSLMQRRSWAWRQSLALVLCLVMVVSGFTTSATVGQVSVGSPVVKVPSAINTALAPQALALAQAKVSSAIRPENLSAALDTAEKAAAAIPRSTFDVDAKAAELGPDVSTTFAFVRDQVREEVYEGVLRGAKGALMARAGNAFDRSLLLGALLRHHGMDVRYVRGELGRARAEQLVARMFTSAKHPAQVTTSKPLEGPPAILEAAAGGLMDVTVNRWSSNVETVRRTLDRSGVRLGQRAPASREVLIQEVTNHLWVEYRQGDAWTPLDASFPDAAPGQTFAVTADTFDEIPRSAFHQVTIRETVEERLDGGVKTREVLRHDATAADLNGAMVTLRHDIDSTRTEWSARPVLQLDDRRVAGEAVVGASSNAIAKGFGGITELFGDDTPKKVLDGITAVWLEFDFRYPSGRTETVRRDIFDRIGPAARAGRHEATASLASVAESGGMPLQLASVFSCWFSAGTPDPGLALNRVAPFIAPLRAAIPLLQTSGRAPAAEESRALDSTMPEDALPAMLSVTAAAFYRLSDVSRSVIRTQLGGDVLFYEASPRLTIVSIEPTSVTDGGKTVKVGLSLDLRRNQLRAVAEGPSETSVVWANTSRGVLDGVIERVLGDSVRQTQEPSASLSAVTLMDRARATGIGITTVRSGEDIHALHVSEEAASRMIATLGEDVAFVVPVHSVPFGGIERLGWWRVDLKSGEALAVLDSGLNGDIVEQFTLWRVMVNNASAGIASWKLMAGLMVEVFVALVSIAKGLQGLANETK